jgi:hypothetical protein
MISMRVLLLFVITWNYKIKLLASSCRSTKMKYIYFTLAADFLNLCFYDQLFETDSNSTTLVLKNV